MTELSEKLEGRLQKDGISLDDLTTEEKVLYVWRLYLDSEVGLLGYHYTQLNALIEEMPTHDHRYQAISCNDHYVK